MMSSVILRTAMRLILPLMLLFAAYMAIKGHNEPGGGFIGGLVAAVALALYRMSDGREALRRLVPMHPRVLIYTGLIIALATAFLPLLVAEPLLTSLNFDVHLGFGQSFHFASAVFFDAGVLLVVVGVSVGMITRFSEELGV